MCLKHASLFNFRMYKRSIFRQFCVSAVLNVKSYKNSSQTVKKKELNSPFISRADTLNKFINRPYLKATKHLHAESQFAAVKG